MNRIISRYLSATVLKHYFLVTLVALVVAGLIQILENRQGLLDQADIGPAAILQYALLSAPDTFARLAGFIALVSVLTACVSLLRYSELKVVLVSGLAYGQFILALAPAALVMAGLHFMMDNAVLPLSSVGLHEWNAAHARSGSADAIWVREDRDILKVGHLAAATGTLTGVELFRLNEQGDLVSHLAGPTAELQGGELVFPVARETIAGSHRTTLRHDVKVGTSLDAGLLSALALHPRDSSFWSITQIIERSTATAYPPYVYQLWLQRKLSSPLMTALMVLMLVPLVQYVHRVNTVRLLFAGLAAGFLYFVTDALITGLAEAGSVQPAATWGLPLLLAALLLIPPVLGRSPARPTP
ncbi:MAG: LptF/LptG family permease [Alphaproteobacteria bacterium]|nr:LptF/LptG family permease [Alphaproteobacteria bacterium]